jgi:hypothetical protein
VALYPLVGIGLAANIDDYCFLRSSKLLDDWFFEIFWVSNHTVLFLVCMAKICGRFAHVKSDPAGRVFFRCLRISCPKSILCFRQTHSMSSSSFHSCLIRFGRNCSRMTGSISRMILSFLWMFSVWFGRFLVVFSFC